MGEYLAARRDLSLVCVPTVPSVDAFFAWASGVRQGGCVSYEEGKPPDRLVDDWAVLGAARSFPVSRID